MKPDPEDELASWARALRESATGKASDPDATRAAVLRSRAPKRADRVVWLVAAAAMLTLVSVPTAWAYYTGYFVETAHEPEMPAPAAEALRAPRATLIEAPAMEAQAIEVPVVASPAIEAPIEVEAPLRRPVSRVPIDPAERETYEAAHALHFEQHDAEGALTAWDAYLAHYPQGRFAPEAHYNRALTLVRLGRRDEAITALTPFENGAFGGYRQREAIELRAAIGETP